MISLSKEEAKEIFKLPLQERQKYILTARVDLEKNLLIFGRGNGAIGSIDLGFFTPSGTETPDFDHLEIIDHGQTIKFGNYEAATDSILEEVERVYSNPPRKDTNLLAK